VTGRSKVPERPLPPKSHARCGTRMFGAPASAQVSAGVVEGRWREASLLERGSEGPMSQPVPSHTIHASRGQAPRDGSEVSALLTEREGWLQVGEAAGTDRDRLRQVGEIVSRRSPASTTPAEPPPRPSAIQQGGSPGGSDGRDGAPTNQRRTVLHSTSKQQ
jgi:hypothetical protein